MLLIISSSIALIPCAILSFFISALPFPSFCHHLLLLFPFLFCLWGMRRHCVQSVVHWIMPLYNEQRAILHSHFHLIISIFIPFLNFHFFLYSNHAYKLISAPNCLINLSTVLDSSCFIPLTLLLAGFRGWQLAGWQSRKATQTGLAMSRRSGMFE